MAVRRLHPYLRSPVVGRKNHYGSRSQHGTRWSVVPLIVEKTY